MIVDDMPEPLATGTADLARFKAGWQCPVLWTAADYRQALSALGLGVVREMDLTGDVRPRPLVMITVLTILNRLARLVPSAPFQHVMDSHRGGLALERMTHRGQMRYRLLVARKGELQVS
ncbi:MAG: hypothetical protein QM736_10850 [Vicinamibacterales bacterium]